MRMWFGGLGRDKYYCVPCDYVAKAKHTPACPTCREPMTYMTDEWRPGRKGSRTRLWDERVPQHRQDAARLRSRAYGTRHWVSRSGVTGEWIEATVKRASAKEEKENT